MERRGQTELTTRPRRHHPADVEALTSTRGREMSATGTSRPRRRGARLSIALALAVVAVGASAAAASAKGVNIVRQAGPPAGAIPKGTQYFTTIQAAVNAS